MIKIIPAPLAAGAGAGGGNPFSYINIIAGTITTDTSQLTTTVTRASSGVAFGAAWKLTITDTASASGSLAMQILGGASGTTELLKVDKTGVITFAGSHYLTSQTANIASLLRTSDNVGTNLFLGNVVALGNGLQINTGNTYASQGNRIGFFGIGPGPGTQATAAFSTTGMIGWTNSATEAYAAFDTNASRISAGLLAIGTGTAGSFAGNLKLTDLQFVGTVQPTASLSTGMTVGFVNIAGAAGAATGTVTNTTGVPIYYDTTANKLMAYNGGWKTLATAFA